MATLYVASTETFVGKSATCIGLLTHAQRDGYTVSYMKPISVSAKHTEETVMDEDASFIRNYFGISTPLDQVAPVLVTQGLIEQIMRSQGTDFAKRIQEAYVAVSRDTDFVVLEGTNTWAEGGLLGLTGDQVSDMLHAPVLLVARYHSPFALDTIMAVQTYLGNRLLGVMLNQVEEYQVDFVQSRVMPFLERRGVPVYATLTQDPHLHGINVDDLFDHLGGQFIGSQEWGNRLVEHLMIGAMGPESALSHFRRRTNKAVFTGGDRGDLQLAALETSTSVLVLTGNIRPSPAVIDRAEEQQVPIILIADDTLTAVERAEAIFGKIRFRQQAKIERFTALLDQNFDFSRLYDELGLTTS
ncbi:MAG: phosphotransacetylase family protein [Chloroflexi bacterium AL-W]|nr:phosphotransacetylase family protein [Chloroflexi bacterium AL-N1]NOK68156.1 phosphotransacetylase family protein [Chloroflexi bacterium AL-N10]NOK73496.1 phosphotransacetylase family protein [Chloroflexi bacterium AL-N5]NOK83410.1 phosphotransacetylase family protein [Chloroflexi bacterium AL-W]NOK87827.1 phosphotransacetylase family protein [Chloroflexi bacterium AL-N15]